MTRNNELETRNEGNANDNEELEVRLVRLFLLISTSFNTRSEVEFARLHSVFKIGQILDCGRVTYKERIASITMLSIFRLFANRRSVVNSCRSLCLKEEKK